MMTSSRVIPLELAAVVILIGVYFLLALFRVAYLDMTRLRRDSVLRQVGRQDPFLERWADSRFGDLLPLGSQVAFQGTLILISLLAADMVHRLLPALSSRGQFVLTFLATFLVLVIIVRVLVVRALVHLMPRAAVRTGARISGLVAFMLIPLLVPLDRLMQRWPTRIEGNGEERTESELKEEVQAFVSMGEEVGILEKDEGELVRNVVDFGDTIVREIMTPRTEMVAVNRTARLDEVRQVFMDAKHSRIPVQDDSVDRIVGILYLKDLLPVWREEEDRRLDDLVRPGMFVPETKKIADLLREMQRYQMPFAVVVDEYGGTAGLVTVEDIVEELVGEIQDEHEETRDDFVEEGPGVWLVAGSLEVERAAVLVGLKHTGVDVETIGGLVTSLLGRVPEAGETVLTEGVHMDIVEADGRRVLKLRLRGQARRVAGRTGRGA